VTAAAFTPDSCVQTICHALKGMGFCNIEYDGLRATVLFKPIGAGAT